MIFRSNRKMNKNNLFIIILKFNKIKTKIINILKIKMKVILMNKKMRKFNQSFNNKLKNKVEEFISLIQIKYYGDENLKLNIINLNIQ